LFNWAPWQQAYLYLDSVLDCAASAMKVLLVEDDEMVVSCLTTVLAAHNYTVEAVTDGLTGWDYAQATAYDVIILDWDLPELDGRSLCERLRKAQYPGAILLLTSKGDAPSKVAGLDAGADDYVVKPCLPEELVARLRALLRRPRELTEPILQWGALQLDPSKCRVTFAGQLLTLSPKEYSLLELFLRHPQRIFSSAVLIERLWTFEETPGEETIRTHIKRLRRKLKRVGAQDVIENIYGIGYRLAAVPAEAMVSSSAESTTEPESAAASLEAVRQTAPAVAPSSASPVALAEAARAASRANLYKFKPVIEARMAHLEAAAAALQNADHLSEEMQQAAQQAAHKLAGSLGMFGLTAESEQCKVLEQCLVDPRSQAHQITAAVQQVRLSLAFVLESSEAKVPPIGHESLPSSDFGTPPVMLPWELPAAIAQELLVVTPSPALANQLQMLTPPAYS
jgi:two-component system OmpR family response regulator